MKVRISGLSTPVDAISANMAGPDSIGLDFRQDSAHMLNLDSAMGVCSMIGSITIMGLFDGKDLPLMRSVVESGMIDVIELDDCEDEAVISEAESFGLPVYRGFTVCSEEDIDRIRSVEADMRVLRVECEISVLEKADFDYILAGNFAPKEVLGIVRMFAPYGLDADAGVDSAGTKDPTKMTAFVYAARGDFEPKLYDHHKDQ